ncbi:alcohol dehydrogenase [Radiomyces spectabilis]|uniref:alcohol dehydrogenase n=1 Tax=Radiomyces spectabilis TaxID=64574 RepID=UPI00221F5A5C|nr:alcohol dehydrogenase [Radiomyces spectabilis]KAI8384842.1 alcohol dehydrogenase [Radiomyces spectabilis]
MAAAASRSRVVGLLKLLQSSSNSCPCHSHAHSHSHGATGASFSNLLRYGRQYASAQESTDYAFEMAASNIRFGPNVTSEIGMDLNNIQAKKVAVYTDATISKLHPLKAVIESLDKHKVNYVVYDTVRVEPTDTSFKQAIEFARQHAPDAFVAVGGGSVIDTTKAASLYSSHPEADFLDFVNAPIGRGLPIRKKLPPLIAVPTTAGTGSETTGTAIFDYEPLHTKTGIAHRALKPLLGIVDPMNTRSMPSQVHASSGLDVLCHALESYTALPYNERSPRPKDPIERPAYQGSNPISDVWSLHALRMVVQYLPRAVKDPEDFEAQSQMLLAATFAGIGFGNAGVHLCHGLSYPISGLNKNYKHPGYEVDHPIIPHGVSVALTAPAVFRYTAHACPDRHIDAAAAFGADPAHIKSSMAGEVLSEKLTRFFEDLGVPNGLSALGYDSSYIPSLVDGALPQHRVTKLAPTREPAREQLASIFENAMKNY